MDVWLESEGGVSTTGRIGLVCHAASINMHGTHSSVLLRERVGDRLSCLLGPEHGFWGTAAAGEHVPNGLHPEWGIPVFSLYSGQAPALDEIAGLVDTIVFDLQDISTRCYTYVHTLRQMLEFCADYEIELIVTDRASPLAMCMDGPMLVSEFKSIVAPVPTPYVYGMTPGETAMWLRDELSLSVRLKVVPAAEYKRNADPSCLWAHWVPPSPAIRSWNAAWAFPVMVFTEALKQLDCARHTGKAFQILHASWLQVDSLLDELVPSQEFGAKFTHWHDEETAAPAGIQLTVVDLKAYRPAALSVSLLHALQKVHGVEAIWRHSSVDEKWFDKLWGTNAVRLALQSDESAVSIIQSWDDDLSSFSAKRANVQLYDDD